MDPYSDTSCRADSLPSLCPKGIASRFSRGRGELIWYAKDGTFKHIAYCHPRTILQWQSRILLVEGFAHLGSNSGIIWEIEMNKDGLYEITQWETLPGHPHLSYIKPDGSLYVATSHGDMVIHADGTITEAPCMSDTL